MNSNIIAEEITCACGNVFSHQKTTKDLEWINLIVGDPICSACEEADRIETEKVRVEKARTDRLESIAIRKAEMMNRMKERTPSRYQMTDIDHPQFNRKLWEKIKSVKLTQEKPWLGLIGESGGSKTRCAYLKLSQIVTEAIDEGKKGSFETVTAYELAEAVRSQYVKEDNIGDQAKNLLRRLVTVQFLLIDDLGKAKATEAVASEMFAIIDRRHAENLPTIWTANNTPEMIARGMPDDIAGPFAGRLIDCSVMIKLS